jgi:hypothetical protein
VIRKTGIRIKMLAHSHWRGLNFRAGASGEHFERGAGDRFGGLGSALRQ